MGQTLPYAPDPQWVMVHEKISNGAKVAYSIMRGNIKHANGPFPEGAFRMDANWLASMMVNRRGGRLDRKTASGYLAELVKYGALRIKDAPAGSPAEYEFVVDPGEKYDGDRSVAAREKRLRKEGVMPRTSRFDATELSGDPAATGVRVRREWAPGGSDARSRGRRRAPRKKVDPTPERLDAAREEELAQIATEFDTEPAESPVDESCGEEEFTIDESIGAEESRARVTPEMQHLAELLELRTARRREPALRLTQGDCRRVAEACAPALERGWNPEEIAVRLTALLNAKIHTPGRFLVKKAADLGAPPKALSPSIDVAGFDASGYDPQRAGRERLRREEEERRRREEELESDPEARRLEQEAKEIADRARQRLRNRRMVGGVRS